jgi:hypothetical protein
MPSKTAFAQPAWPLISWPHAAPPRAIFAATPCVADLTAASTLAVLIRPADSPMSCPQPVASRFRELMDRYANHPGAAWVRRMYDQHRGSRRDFEGPSAEAA